MQPGDNFCGVGGVRVSSDAQDAAPSPEIPAESYPPPNVPSREGSRALGGGLGHWSLRGRHTKGGGQLLRASGRTGHLPPSPDAMGKS